MTSFRPFLFLIVVCTLLIGSVPLAVSSTPRSTVLPTVDNLSATTNQQLAQARRATAKYHDIAQAEADGYAQMIARLRAQSAPQPEPEETEQAA